MVRIHFYKRFGGIQLQVEIARRCSSSALRRNVACRSSTPCGCTMGWTSRTLPVACSACCGSSWLHAPRWWCTCTSLKHIRKTKVEFCLQVLPPKTEQHPLQLCPDSPCFLLVSHDVLVALVFLVLRSAKRQRTETNGERTRCWCRLHSRLQHLHYIYIRLFLLSCAYTRCSR